ncbi:chain-length determining protein [Pseudomonas sp. FFUP_PS_473]|uniref:Wzz/FepE/Etk N-terminal domain-containing protein n=1 Tax=Pseudomonas sp. FFUP_PS_473 TaxID=2060418 RepID=UPI000C7A4235|nr:Wzz/FepE/Etk N-terminal domain-containing protein [Pseudomonas sp. FFUP_PS_473]PLP89233.1 chain-length determining protein [Pseudomonas sp. FFUP_PS_473]
MTSITRVPSVVAHDEIDLFAMMQSIWKQKKLIAAMALFVGAIAGAYAFLATPEYEVSTLLRPAALNDLDALNRTEVYSLPPGKALVRVGAALDSYDTRLSYFRANPKLFEAFGKAGQSPEQVFEEFNRDSLKLVQPDPKKADLLSAYVGLEMRYPKGIAGDEILNGFVQYAIENERKQIAADLKVIISNRLSELDDKLDAARAAYDAEKEGKIATLLEADNLKRAQLQDELKALRVQLKVRREDRIAQLDESISIARSLGLKKPSTPSSMASEGGAGSNIIRTEVNNQQIPLYFMGTDALEAERKALRQRTSDDFVDPQVAQIRKELLLLNTNRQVEVLNQRENEEVFLSGIEPLRAERMRLANINIDMQQLNLVNVDRLALQPVDPIKPKKALVVGLGLLVGILCGLIFAISRHFLMSHRIQSLQASLMSRSKVIDSEANLGKSS